MKATDSKRLSFSQITEGIEQGYTGLDTVRVSAMEGLIKLRKIKAQAIERELQEAKKAGDREAIAFHTERAQANNRLTTMLQHEATVAATKIPKPKKNVAIVHGHVWIEREGRLEAVPNAHVVVGLAEDEELGRRLAEARTDKCGYFSVAVELKAVPGKVTTRLVSTSHAAGAAAPAEESDPTQTLDGVVAVLDSSGKKTLVQASVRLAVNTVSYRELLLPKDGDCKQGC